MCRASVRALFLVLGLVALASPAAAQVITGVVSDSSGGVLPGVTVEAASPALIEGTRSVVTDAGGRYQIVALRPGTYVVTFTLSGFTTVKRDGIVIQQDFTAAMNVQLAVGDVSEVVVVRSETPLVDAQNLSRPQAITSEMLQSLPLNNR